MRLEGADEQAGLQIPQLKVGSREPWAPRLFYAYAEALLAKGDEEGALTWFGHAASADLDGDTDAAERLSELDGTVLVDLLEGEVQDRDQAAGGRGERKP